MKKITIALSFIILFFCFTACGTKSIESDTNKTTKENQTETDNDLSDNEEESSQSFTDFAKDFVKKVKTENVFSYINKDYGLFIRHNPGTSTLVLRVNNLEEIENVLYRETLTSKFSLKEGKIPSFSCDDNKWSKDGCFWKKDKHSILIDTYDILLEYELIEKDELNKEDYNIAKKLSSQQTYAIYATDIVTGFYFIKINNKYYLYLIDVYFPCSA